MSVASTLTHEDCTCGHPEFGRWPEARFHTWNCVLRTGLNIGHVLQMVGKEVEKARAKFPPLNSPHEAKAVIEEELEELWEHVKANTATSREARQEAIQIAAMAIRYVLDITDPPRV